jgi:hypothetical protein
VPVYNVSMALLHRMRPGGAPFKVVELATDAQAGGRADRKEPVPEKSAVDGRVERRSDHPDRRAAATPARSEPDIK